MNQSEQGIDKLAEALAKAQGIMKAPKKDRTVVVRTKSGGTYEFDYATFDAIVESARGPLSANGIAFVQAAQIEGGQVVIETRLIHSSGQWLSTSLSAGQSESGPQALGSLISYLKRYSLSALLGIVADEDDDGNAATGNEARQKVSARAPSAVGGTPDDWRDAVPGEPAKPAAPQASGNAPSGPASPSAARSATEAPSGQQGEPEATDKQRGAVRGLLRSKLGAESHEDADVALKTRLHLPGGWDRLTKKEASTVIAALNAMPDLPKTGPAAAALPDSTPTGAPLADTVKNRERAIERVKQLAELVSVKTHRVILKLDDENILKLVGSVELAVLGFEKAIPLNLLMIDQLMKLGLHLKNEAEREA